MFGTSRYTISPRGGSWPPGERLITAESEPVAVVREEPWPEVLARPWPDGTKARPWLPWLLGVDRHPRQSRTTARRLDDGRPLVRLHRRQPLFNHTVGVFDHEDRRVAYGRWPFKQRLGDEFDIVGVDHRRVAEVRRSERGTYRVAGAEGGPEWGIVTASGGAADCRVSLDDAERERWGAFLLAAVLMIPLEAKG